MSMDKVVAACRRHLNDPHVPEDVRRGKHAYVYLYGKGHELFRSFQETNDRALLQPARECFETAVISYNHDGTPVMPMFYDMILLELGAVCANQGEYGVAIDILSHCLRLSRQHNYQSGVCGALNNLGMVYEMKGDYPKARDSYREVLDASGDGRRLPDEDNVARTCWNLGRVELRMNNAREALELLESACRTFERLGLRHFGERAESDLRRARAMLASDS